jgi:hypothetical protein
MRATTGITTATVIVLADVECVDGGNVGPVCDGIVMPESDAVVLEAVLLIGIVEGADRVSVKVIRSVFS